MSSKILINDFLDELREENNRLLNELQLSQKCNQLLESYRNCLTIFNNNCKCNENIENKQLFKRLENVYKTIFANNEKQTEINNELNAKNIPQNTIELNGNNNSRNNCPIISNNENVINQQILNNPRINISKIIKIKIEKPNDNSLKQTIDIEKPVSKSVNLSEKEENNDSEENDLSFGTKDLKALTKTPIITEIKFCCDRNRCRFWTTNEEVFKAHQLKHKERKVVKKRPRIIPKKIDNKTNNDSNINNIKTESIQVPEKKYLSKLGSLLEEVQKINELNGYQCRYANCNFKSDSLDSLKEHINENHIIVNAFRCEKCSEAFFDKSSLNKHIKSKHENPKFKCDIPFCKYSTAKEESAKRHQRRHLGGKGIKCPYEGCDRDFNHKNSLEIHINRIHKKCKPYVCDQCDYRCTGKGMLAKHLVVKHTSDFKYKCNQCHYKTNVRYCYELHLNCMHSDEKMFKCDIDGCNETFRRPETLRKHKFVHNIGQKLNCDWPECEAQFYTQTQLTVHMRSHTGEKPFNCNECDKSFVDNKRLSRHKLAVHKKHRFKCSQCEYTTNVTNALKTHTKTHSNEKPFKCTIDGCEKTFKQKECLTSHELNVHNGWTIKCDFPDCGKAFKSMDRLTVHKRNHSGEKPFACNRPNCDAKFSSERNLKVHYCYHEKTKIKCDSKDCKIEFYTHTLMRKHYLNKHQI